MSLRIAIRSRLDKQVRPALAAIRSRGDWSVLSAVARDGLNLRYRTNATSASIHAAMDWLCAAHDATSDDGVAAYYDMRTGSWAPSYPETTGYIIPTFFDFAITSANDTYRQRALRMADWLLTLQLDDGAFPMGPLWPDLERKPIVFDTGQIIHGLARAFEESSDSRYLQAAQRAGDWLIATQETDGSWRKDTFLQNVHTYNVRVAWAMLRIDQASGTESYRDAATRNLNWTLGQQKQDGWFANAAFNLDEEPVTHTLAYTIRGMLESGILLDDQSAIEAARRAADALRDRQKHDGYLSGTFGADWRSSAKWSCLTGNAQMAIVWLRLFELTGDSHYLKAASRANQYLKQVQRPDGAVAGSFPIYGNYHAYLHVNWAAKFFVDSLLLESRLSRQEDVHDDES